MKQKQSGCPTLAVYPNIPDFTLPLATDAIYLINYLKISLNMTTHDINNPTNVLFTCDKIHTQQKYQKTVKLHYL